MIADTRTDGSPALPTAVGPQTHMIDVIPLDRIQAQPWRNGGGLSRDLLTWPSAADWLVRIGVAELTRDGPFSDYAGTDRWFTIADGAGVHLRFAAHRQVLDGSSAPLQFDGAAAPGCELLDGATRALNLLVRHAAGRGAMQSTTLDEEWLSPAPLRALFCTGAARLQIDDTDAAQLPAWSLAWSDHAAQQRWRVLGDGVPVRAWWLSFEPHPRPSR